MDLDEIYGSFSNPVILTSDSDAEPSIRFGTKNLTTVTSYEVNSDLDTGSIDLPAPGKESTDSSSSESLARFPHTWNNVRTDLAASIRSSSAPILTANYVNQGLSTPSPRSLSKQARRRRSHTTSRTNLSPLDSSNSSPAVLTLPRIRPKRTPTKSGSPISKVMGQEAARKRPHGTRRLNRAPLEAERCENAGFLNQSPRLDLNCNDASDCGLNADAKQNAADGPAINFTPGPDLTADPGFTVFEDENEEPSQAASFGAEDEIRPRNVDDAIRKLISASLTAGIVKKILEKKKGCVYIVSNEDRPDGHFKIGTTNGTELERRRQLQNSCGSNLNPQHHSQDVAAAKRAEDLCHTHLVFFNRAYRCQKCRNAGGFQQEHREYFEIDCDIAIEYVRLWTRFAKHEPYDKKGILKRYWEERLRNLEPFPDDEKHDDHGARLRRWANFVDIGPCDKIWRWKTERVVQVVGWYNDIKIWRFLFIATALIAYLDLLLLYGLSDNAWLWGLACRGGAIFCATLVWFYIL